MGKNMYCPKCNIRMQNTTLSVCGICGKRMVDMTPNMPHCPTCGSMQVQKISGLNRAAHGAALGLLSKTARSQFECKSCGYKF